ncbi:DUF6616 family protein [Zobellella sp. DQSA1]|uniref:DUF6616 family protein n=1 Tax=Zobellella sp. DQSA1 TaxID=3342386 RepID=UPI0035BFEB11
MLAGLAPGTELVLKAPYGSFTQHHDQALPAEQRQQFINGIQVAMGGLSSLGVEVLALSETDTNIDKASKHRFLGIWCFPNIQTRDALLTGMITLTM